MIIFNAHYRSEHHTMTVFTEFTKVPCLETTFVTLVIDIGRFNHVVYCQGINISNQLEAILSM